MLSYRTLIGHFAVLWLQVTSVADAAECTCDCCKAAFRVGSMQVKGQNFECLPETADQNAQCGSNSCTPAAGEGAITSGVGKLEYARFCHYTCVPKEPDAKVAGGLCNKAPQELLVANYPNGVDPANLVEPEKHNMTEELKDPDAPPEAPELSDAEDLARERAKALALSKAQAANSQEDKDTGAAVAEAAGKKALAAGLEARSSEAEAKSARLLGGARQALRNAQNNVNLINGASAKIEAAAVQAAIYSHSAAKAAARAKAEYKELQEIPKWAAGEAANEAVRQLQTQVQDAARRKKLMESLNSPPPTPPPLAEAAVRASAPYYDIMQRALSVGALYEAKARGLEDNAHTLQQQSKQIASQAVQYQAAGYPDQAAKLMKQAEDLLTQATADDAQAQKDYAVAEKVHADVPNYQANAAQAAGRAQALANPAGQPPAPRTSLLQRGARRPTLA